MSQKLAITAIMASHNEASLLEDCLDSVSFCDEVIVVDIGSSDGTASVARKHSAKFIKYTRVPTIFEEIHEEIASHAKHDWLLFIDPDERVDKKLAKQLEKKFKEFEADSKLAAIYVPWLFYFKGRPLKGTVWGGENYKRLLMHRGRVDYTGGVHMGTVPKEGYRSEYIPELNGNVVHHLWMKNYSEWLRKHRRYLTLEGRNRFDRGDRAGRRSILTTGPRAFYDSYFHRGGYRDGSRGLFLSLFWAWYNFRSLQELLREQHKHV